MLPSYKHKSFCPVCIYDDGTQRRQCKRSNFKVKIWKTQYRMTVIYNIEYYLYKFITDILKTLKIYLIYFLTKFTYAIHVTMSTNRMNLSRLWALVNAIHVIDLKLQLQNNVKKLMNSADNLAMNGNIFSMVFTLVESL